jgi:hypothetical protein
MENNEDEMMAVQMSGLIEKEIVVKELIPSLGADYGTEDFEYADVTYKYFIANVDDETVVISQLKILQTPDEEEKEHQEQATFHIQKDAFKVFAEMIAEFSASKEQNG